MGTGASGINGQRREGGLLGDTYPLRIEYVKFGLPGEKKCMDTHVVSSQYELFADLKYQYFLTRVL